MIVPVVLLVLMGTIGSLDGLYFHLWKFRLHAQPTARRETALHIFRGVTFAASLGVLQGYVPRGGWYWALLGIFALDLVDDVVDVLIEPSSRKPLGGLPGPEYLIHMLVMAATGGVWTTFAVEGWAGRNGPTTLEPAALPTWLAWDARLMVVGAVLLAVLELGLLLRAGSRAAAPLATTPR